MEQEAVAVRQEEEVVRSEEVVVHQEEVEEEVTHQVVVAALMEN